MTLKESIIDIPRRTYAPGVFDDANTDNPKIKESVKELINKQLEELIKEYPIIKTGLIGSILTKRYRNDADLDINVLFDVPKEKQEEERIRLSKKYLSASSPDSIQGKEIPGTKHPINFYIITDIKTYEEQEEKADAVFDWQNNKWVKKPEDFKFDSDLYVKEFERKVQELDVVKGELKRDIIDYDELKELTPNDVLDLQEKIDSKLDEIEDSIKDIIKIGDTVDAERRQAFDTDMSPDEIRQYGIKNKLPKNVIYKMLEKYHYLKFYKKCKKILEDGQVTDAEIDSIKNEEVTLNDIKRTAQRFAKGIYDKLKLMATTSKRYEYAAKVLQDVIDRKKKERSKEGLPLRHDIGYYASAVADTFKDIDSKKLQSMVHEETITEAIEKSVTFTFGRFNPPTIGHEKLINKVASVRADDYKIYLSKSQDSDKNPLPPLVKLKLMQKMFSKHSRKIMLNPSNMILDIATRLYNEGFRKVNMVVGSDRISEFKTMLNKYNDVKSRHGYYNFNEINIVSAGDRDPDAEGAMGMSASKMREAVKQSDFNSFKKGLPNTLNEIEKKTLFKQMASYMRVKVRETAGGTLGTATALSLKPTFNLRNEYVEGRLYKIGELVESKSTDIVGEIVRRGTNYVTISDQNEEFKKLWITDLQYISEKDYYTKTGKIKISKQDSDIKDKEGTQPKKYFTGLSKDTKDKRDAHFKRNAKKGDSDKSAYEPAPGEKDAKTKPSKYTQKYKKMFGELKKELKDACWTGYKQVGMKNKGGKQVPNCVPEAYDIGHDYAEYTSKITPGEPNYDPNFQGSAYTPAKSGSGEQIIKAKQIDGYVTQKDVENYKTREDIKDKYKKRYGDDWESKFNHTIKSFKDFIE